MRVVGGGCLAMGSSVKQCVDGGWLEQRSKSVESVVEFISKCYPCR